MLQVKDTGCGISPQDMPHTFTKFAHPQNATNKVQNGNGLGLALSRRLVKLFFSNAFPLENI
jgi:ethylene receptor